MASEFTAWPITGFRLNSGTAKSKQLKENRVHSVIGLAYYLSPFFLRTAIRYKSEASS